MMGVSQEFSSLLFDMDGTLVDSRSDLALSVNHVLSHLGHPAQSESEITARIGNGLRQLLRDSLKISDMTVLKEAKEIFEAHYAEHCIDKTKLYPGVRETLDGFLGRFKMSVVTNKPFSFAQKIVDELNLGTYFSVVVGGDTTVETKPHPAPLYLAMQQMKANPDEVLIVGDGIQDMKAGKAAKIQTCLARYGFGFHPELLTLSPDYTITEFIQLKEIVS